MTRLGQHFLANAKASRRIARALDIQDRDTIIEIGPGHGELTSELVNWLIGKNRKLILIEKDNILIESLRKKYGENKKIEIISGDVLKILPRLINQLTNSPINYKLVGNIPYYITGKLLRLISELERKPSQCVFTLQKEVAERICAKPPRANRLAASVQFWAEPEIIATLSRENFRPKPEVESAIVKLESRIQNLESSRIAPEKYYRTVRILFQQPRKTILNNLSGTGGFRMPKNEIAERLRGIGIPSDARPQNLSVEDILRIAHLVIADEQRERGNLFV